MIADLNYITGNLLVYVIGSAVYMIGFVLWQVFEWWWDRGKDHSVPPWKPEDK